MRKFFWSVLVFLAILGGLFYIDPQIKPSHTEPYLSLGAESQAPAPAADTVLQRVLLFGDAGHSATDPWQPSLAQVAARASLLPDRTVVVALGDNIYMTGYPQKEAGQQEWTEDQKESISFLEAQLKVADVSGASLYLVPGNHDWLATEVESQALHIQQYAREHQANVFFEPREINQPPLFRNLQILPVPVLCLSTPNGGWRATTSAKPRPKPQWQRNFREFDEPTPTIWLSLSNITHL